MKNRSLVAFAVIAVLSFCFMGCPVSSTYPLGEKGKEKMDKAFFGTWKNDSTSSEAIKITISKGSDGNTCKVHVDEKGGMFMAESQDFNGWLTKIEDKTFFVLQEIVDGTAKETYYVYHVTVDKNQLITNDISLKVGGVDAITSTPAYREEVSASMKKEDFLSGKIVWKKL